MPAEIRQVPYLRVEGRHSGERRYLLGSLDTAVQQLPSLQTCQ